MKKLFLISILAISLNSCTNTESFNKGKYQLELQGYTNIKNTGYKAFCCGKDDSFSDGFEAIDKNGNIQKGCFCSGIFKGVTIRFE